MPTFDDRRLTSGSRLLLEADRASCHNPAAFFPQKIDDSNAKDIESIMGLKRDNLERQLSQATSELTGFEKSLTDGGVNADRHARNPKWRNLQARCRQLRSRLNAVAKQETVNQELETRKATAAAEA